ncbi:MAG: T9SS type A sorting domain-containing protein [candidate division KSB1 bacterium]|nr:T9SS type A sorting domain-containing protein [candidate division KSB1 bacterium]
MSHPAYYDADDYDFTPLFVFHEPDAHTAAEIDSVADRVLPENTLLAWNEGYDWDVFRHMDLLYPWAQPMNKNWHEQGQRWGDEYLDFEYENMNKSRGSHGVYFAIGAAWPGFDDRSWVDGTDRWIDRQDTLVYHQTWEKIHAYQQPMPMPWVLLQSWNDFNRSTHLDLSQNNRFTFLTMTRDHIARFKADVPPKDDLALVAAQHLHMARIFAEQRPQEKWLIESSIEQGWKSIMNGEYYKALSIFDQVMGIAPNPLTVEVGTDQIHLSWRAAPYATGYRIALAADSGPFDISHSTAPAFVRVTGTDTVLSVNSLPVYVAVAPEADLDIVGRFAWYQNVYTRGGIYKVDRSGVTRLQEADKTVNQDMQVIQVPEKTQLSQNYPNPFNPVTTIEYQLDQAQHVKLNIYNMNGRLMDQLVNQSQDAGVHRIQWRAHDQPSGLYFYQLQTESLQTTRRMLLVR